MRISIVGPGHTAIPPTGWGAVETLIWDMRNALKKLGHAQVTLGILKDQRCLVVMRILQMHFQI